MLYDASRAGNASAELFEPAYWHARAATSRAPGGRGTTLFLDDGARHWVLRHYFRGGTVAKLLGDRYLWTGEARTRPFRELRMLADLRAEGLPVPVPVAARYERNGLLYRGDLITERIPDARPLSVWLEEAPLPAQAWRAIGLCLREFYDLGVWHADLNAHNVLLDSSGNVSVIDFDRARRRKPGPALSGKNLGRLAHSLDKLRRTRPRFHCGETEWGLLLAAHRAHG